MTDIELKLEHRARDYEDALEAALDALQDYWDAYSSDIAAITELRDAFRTAGL
ncbi:hypothetical protein LZK98_11805 [Sphingomonas cannabina]|uniref:hypothetical protein n=1 Tax=Sphingomonas cannabina TaxID=2899123 RepID=UPI001F2039AC|nr:hypothetical protein [Sphingomonas cannabina]UIJ43776.1 hypothetical protein LZK98_11805 [Sphingomonas cannabina]